jgi:hypothetical protein
LALLEHLRRDIKNDANEKSFIFCIDQIITSLDGSVVNGKDTNAFFHEYLKLILDNSITLKMVSPVKSSNKLFNILYKWIHLEKWEEVKKDKIKWNTFESNLREQLNDVSFFGKILIVLQIFLKTSNYYVQNQFALKIVGLKYFMNLIAILDSTIFAKEDRDEEGMKILLEFLEFAKKLVNINYDIEFDSYFIIRHQLYNFESILREKVLNESEEFSQKKLSALISAKEYLVDTSLIYSMMKKLEDCGDYSLRLELTKLIWYLFDEISMGEKISIIYEVYSNNEIKLDRDSYSVTCLMDENFNTELILTINQLSAENFEDVQVNIEKINLFL